jgi:ribose/xylose/arabinose/galactoside ABC-type transport system permease subunit
MQTPSVWSKLLKAQEFGLVVVIAVMMAGLTLFTPSIPSPQRRVLSAGETVTVQGDLLVVQAMKDGKPAGTESYSQAEGWTVFERGTIRRLDRKERVVLPASATVEQLTQGDQSSGWRVNNAGAASGEYLSGPGFGWSLSESDGQKVMVRDPHVNRFLNKRNLAIVLTSASFFAIMAVGMTAVIVLGGIDLSVGAIYALAAVLGAAIMQKMQAGGDVSTLTALIVGVGVCCITGAICGLINGSASVWLGVHPFIITLGGMGVYRGLAFVTTDGQSISDLPAGFGNFMRLNFLGIDIVPTIVMIAVGLFGAWLFTRTVLGRRIFATGGNEIAAKYAGVPVGVTKIKVFVLVGLLSGLSAAVALGLYGSASSADGTGYELEVIAAAVIGGASLSGGRGTAVGAILGAIVIQLINNGFVVLEIDPQYKQIVIGLAIVVAVVIDQLKNKVTAGAGKKH